MLGTEHTTISRHIRNLEQDLRTQLFHRSNQGYELTDAGRRFEEMAEQVESAVVSARITAIDEAQISGTVRIGAPDGFGTVFLAPLLGELARKFPQLHVEIFATPRLFSLSKREADIAVSLSVPNQVRVVSRRLIDYRLYVYAAPKYLADVEPIHSVEEMREHTFIGYSEEQAFSSEVEYLNVVGPTMTARIGSMSLVAQAYAARGGAGLCILPAFVQHSFPELVPILPDQIFLTRSFHMHIHEDHKKAPHVRAVADFIVEKVEANASIFKGPFVK